MHHKTYQNMGFKKGKRKKKRKFKRPISNFRFQIFIKIKSDWSGAWLYVSGVAIFVGKKVQRRCDLYFFSCHKTFNTLRSLMMQTTLWYNFFFHEFLKCKWIYGTPCIYSYIILVLVPKFHKSSVTFRAITCGFGSYLEIVIKKFLDISNKIFEKVLKEKSVYN